MGPFAGSHVGLKLTNLNAASFELPESRGAELGRSLLPKPYNKFFVVFVEFESRLVASCDQIANAARVLVKNAKTGDTVCELYPRTFKNDTRVKFFACSYDYWSSKSFGDCRNYKTASAINVGNFVPEFFEYDPDALLTHFRK